MRTDDLAQSRPRDPRRNQMNLEGVDIFQAYTISGTTKIPAELALRYRLLRRRGQIADRHVLDHTAAKRADLRVWAAKNPRSSQIGGDYC